MNQPWMEQALTQLQTPFYLFDTDAAAAQVEALRKKLPDRVGLCYAVKANPFLIWNGCWTAGAADLPILWSPPVSGS